MNNTAVTLAEIQQGKSHAKAAAVRPNWETTLEFDPKTGVWETLPAPTQATDLQEGRGFVEVAEARPETLPAPSVPVSPHHPVDVTAMLVESAKALGGLVGFGGALGVAVPSGIASGLIAAFKPHPKPMRKGDDYFLPTVAPGGYSYERTVEYKMHEKFTQQ